MSQTLILTLKLAKKNQITEESLRVEFQESKNSGVFPFFFGGGGKNIQQAVMQMAGDIQLVPKALPTLTSRLDC